MTLFSFQYPDNPTRQQKKDVKELVSSFLPLPLVINYRISSKKLENVVDLFESLMYRCYLEYTLAGNVEITLKKFLEQILYRLDRMLNFLSGYVMCIMLLIEALANQYSPVNELMQGGANWTVNRMHVKLLVVHQFLGRYGRNLPKND
ncbi:hypothetical protein HKD37_15G043932 [Glycine soja]